MKKQLEKISVLVVDDDPVNRKLVASVLQKSSVGVDEAKTGEEAIQKIRDEHYDVVFMDVYMPGMGGLEATRVIKKEIDENLWDIAITASIMDSDIEECKEAGMDDFISKPFNFNMLLDKVIHAINNKIQPGHRSESQENNERQMTYVNLESLEEMAAGDRDMIRDMIDLFIQKSPAILANIKKAYQDEKIDEMSDIAHSIKPTFKYVGADKGLKISQKIEDYYKNPYPLKELEENIRELELITNQTVEELKEIAAKADD